MQNRVLVSESVGEIPCLLWTDLTPVKQKRTEIKRPGIRMAGQAIHLDTVACRKYEAFLDDGGQAPKSFRHFTGRESKALAQCEGRGVVIQANGYDLQGGIAEGLH